jgi:hypothetical protein
VVSRHRQPESHRGLPGIPKADTGLETEIRAHLLCAKNYQDMQTPVIGTGVRLPPPYLERADLSLDLPSPSLRVT